MQSKTSCFNTAVFRKDFTRFAPVWGLYTIGMVLALVLTALNRSGYDNNFYTVDAFSELPLFMGIVNCGYALVTAQALFGDLFNSRSCYALHAMPVRRETWYVTHVISGLVFSILPTLIAALCALPLVAGSCVVNGWLIPVYVFLAVNLQYICFFGIAVACIFCAGNRLGMLIVYGMVNCAAAVLGMLVEAVYLDMLFGVRIPTERYLRFSPMAHMTNSHIVDFGDYWLLMRNWEQGDQSQPLKVPFTLIPASWRYLGICAAIGAVLLVLGVFLYKRRKLECAGDFLAFRKLGTAFQAVFAFGVGALFQLAFAGYSTVDNFGYCIFLGVGLVVGWFGGRMMLDRTTRVFRKKSLVGLAAVGLAVAVSLGLTYLDPLKIEDWIPEADEIASVSVSGDSFYDLVLEDPEDIAQILTLHELALEERHTVNDGIYRVLKEGVSEADATEADYRYTTYAELRYTMKDGSEAIRHYYAWVDSEAGEILRHYASSPKVILSRLDEVNMEKAVEFEINGWPFPDHTTPENMKSLMEALLADCQEGNMARMPYFHTGYFKFNEENRYMGWRSNSSSLDLQVRDEGYGAYLEIYADCVHTLKWLTDRGILENLGITVVPDEPSPANG